MAAYDKNFRRILGINFFVGQAPEAVRRGLRGGLVVAPAAPALVNLPNDPDYRQAVSHADMAITDSGFMVMAWNLMRRDNIRRVSGLEYLVLLLRSLRSRPKQERPFFIMPTKESTGRTLGWLKTQGIFCDESQTYVAPEYPSGSIVDYSLLKLLKKQKPTQIVIGLGGGTQERLGLFLRQNLPYRPGIHCIGAAIGFLTGEQVKIPMWADHFYLGWLLRCLSKPQNYVPRYWKARKLLWQLFVESSQQNRPRHQLPVRPA
jgi:N-acetylglucosaminyldiphosphoundecaprenol N-acetyl-beta-D-mannosaminyltransferase